jgi:hypothetical protein
MKGRLKDNALSVFFLGIFVVTLIAQSFAGQHKHNAEQAQHGESAISWWHYIRTPDFTGAVMENWQSEFLQFSLFIGATVWLMQKGSNESKKSEDAGTESDEKQKIGRYTPRRGPRWARVDDIRTRLYENSLLIVMTAIFLLTWFAQSLSNWRAFNDEQSAHDQVPLSWVSYVATSDFWEKTLQNWQSEFLAVGTMVVFTIFLRQRGSPESKPVGAPHEETATSG